MAGPPWAVPCPSRALRPHPEWAHSQPAGLRWGWTVPQLCSVDPQGPPYPSRGVCTPPTQRGWDLASLIKDIPNERRVWIALCLHCDGNCKQRGVPKGMPPGPLHRRVAHRPFPLSSRLLPAAVIQCGPCCHLARSPPRGAQRSGWKRKPHLRDRHPSPSPARPDKWTGTKAGMVKLRAVTFPVVPSPGDP